MMYAPPNPGLAGSVVITPYHKQSIGTEMICSGQGSPGLAAWPAANLVIFVPFWIPEATTFTKMFWNNGAVAGNVDVGIYGTDQTRLVSMGSTAVAGANATQIVDIADTTLARGRYYMAMVADTGTTLTLLRAAPILAVCQSFGLLQQASVTLPLSTNASPATFAKYAQAYVPHFGVQGYRTAGP